MSDSIVLLAGTGRSTAIVYNALCRDFAVAAVILEDKPSRFAMLKRRAKKMGWATVAGQTLFRGLVMPTLAALSRRRVTEILSRSGLSRNAIPESVVVRVPSVNSPECIAALRRWEPKVVVVNGTRIIKAEVLNCVPAKFINTHAGITPLYRGVHGAYWALAQNDHIHCGVTVHLVDTGIDTGSVLGQATIQPSAADNFATYPYLQLAAGVPLLREAVRSALAGSLQPQPAPPGQSQLWYHPTLGEYLRYRVAKGVK